MDLNKKKTSKGTGFWNLMRTLHKSTKCSDDDFPSVYRTRNVHRGYAIRAVSVFHFSFLHVCCCFVSVVVVVVVWFLKFVLVVPFRKMERSLKVINIIIEILPTNTTIPSRDTCVLKKDTWPLLRPLDGT